VMAAKTQKLKLVKGGRPTIRSKRPPPPSTRRVTFIPQPDGQFHCVDQDTFYLLRLLAPVSVTVPEGIVSVEVLDHGQ
jgi:hypothetical protein